MKKKIFTFLLFAISQICISQCYTKISAGGYHTLAIKTDGTLWAWGRNSSGELGDGTYESKSMPTQIGNTNDWQSVSANYFWSIAIKTDGTLWAWGENGAGQLGDGSFVNKNIPTQIGNATNWSKLNEGTAEGHCAAIRTDGTIWLWGQNDFGQIGDGTFTDKLYPTPIVNDTDWESIYIGSTFTIAKKTDGSIWSWGGNYFGQLGNGTFISTNYPTQIGSDYDWDTLSVGNDTVLAIKINGSLWGWGWNQSGQIGDGTLITRNTPTQIGNDTNWVKTSSGTLYNLATKTNGTLWGWGLNDNGQLGDGTYLNKSIPTQLNTDLNWVNVYCGLYHSFVTNSLGELYARGDNLFGQYGNGTSTFGNTSIFPTQINCQLLEINDINQDNELISIFPNPSREKIWILSRNNEKIDKVFLIDLLGKNIDIENDSNLTSINIENLDNGVYLLIVTINNTKIIKKIVKE